VTNLSTVETESWLPADFHLNSRLTLSFLLVVTVALMYLPLARYPFVQDDWVLLYKLTFLRGPEVLLDLVSPAGKLFFRPAGLVYCALVYRTFGLNPAGFHLLSLALLTVSSFLVVCVAQRCTGDARVAWGSGFVYAAAATVHFESQMWLVGIFDIGSGACVLLSLRAFLRKQYVVSALFFALALGFKESVAPFPCVLLAWGILDGMDHPRLSTLIRSLSRRLGFHAVVLAVYVACRADGISLFGFPGQHPYAARLFGGNTADHFQLYTRWGMQALLPFKNIAFPESAFLGFLAITAAVCALILVCFFLEPAKSGADRRRTVRLLIFLAVWFLIMVLPPVSLHTQVFRYYLAAALPPLAIMALVLLRVFFESFGRIARYLPAAYVLFVAANVIDATAFVQQRISLGVNEGRQTSTREGYNHLMQKSSVVRAVWKPLLEVLPSVPPHSVILIPGVDTGCFEDRFGPEVWYGDSTLRVTSMEPESPALEGTLRITLPPEDHWKVPIDTNVVVVPASRVFHIWFEERGLELLRSDGRKN
jgi:hypothetical protein